MLNDFDRRRGANGSAASLALSRGARVTRANCFADEVAIDFPSVGAVMDRLRAACADDRELDPLPAEIVLTPTQAFTGVTLPLDVALLGTCAACGGRGEVWAEQCLPCCGTGASTVPHQIRLTVPARVRHGSRLRFSVAPASAPPTLIEVRIAIA